MGVCITLRICRVSNEDEMLIIRFPQNLFAYIGMVIRGDFGEQSGLSPRCPLICISAFIYCFLIGSICIWPSRSVISLADLAQCVAGLQLYVFCVWMCMFCDRRTTSTCSCVSPSSCCTAMMSQSSSSLQIKCCCTLVTSPCTWMESWCWGRYEHTHTHRWQSSSWLCMLCLCVIQKWCISLALHTTHIFLTTAKVSILSSLEKYFSKSELYCRDYDRNKRTLFWSTWHYSPDTNKH